MGVEHQADCSESQGLPFIFVGRYKPAREANVVRQEEMRTGKMDTNVNAHRGHEYQTLSGLHLDAVQVMLMNLVLS